MTTKPWFSKSEILTSEGESRKKNQESVSSMSTDIRPIKKSSIHSSSHIYDTTVDVNANITLHRSLSTSDSFRGRDLCAQELLKIKTVSDNFLNLSIINVFVNEKYETL